MRILVDLNVLLDVIQLREPHYASSAQILSSVARGEIEDAVVAAAAETLRCDWIVTRNLTDFKCSPIPAITPGELIEQLTAS